MQTVMTQETMGQHEARRLSWGAGRGFAHGVVSAAMSLALAMTVLVPVSTAYAQDQTANALMAAEADAAADTSSALWFGAGCLLTWVGILIAYLAEPSPQMARLMGKPGDYVATYTAAYKSAGKSAQTRMALYGCITEGVVVVVVYAAVFATAATAAASTSSSIP